MAELINELENLKPTRLSKEEIHANYDLFYANQEIDKEEIFAKNQKIETEEDTYDCVCCFCSNNTRFCSHSCCKTGIPCKDFVRRGTEEEEL